MTTPAPFEIFLATAPGLESALFDEVRGKGFKQPKQVAGGVTVQGGWPEVWRANLWLRGASKVLARIGAFKAQHLAQLHDRTGRVAWRHILRADVPFQVEASCSKSKLYHSGAVAERIAKAVAEITGASVSDQADLTIKARIDRDLCTLSIDTSGDLLHRRGYKQAVNQAPLRETMAALFLRQCFYDGNEPVCDPMCGAGTFVIEAAEIAARLNPGRNRRFAFEQLASFDAEAWEKMRAVKSARVPAAKFYGSDRDAGAVEMARDNAKRAGVGDYTEFKPCAVSDITAPEGQPGLVIVNPPYGSRLGDKKKLFPLYSSLGQVLKQNFKGWRVGIVTTEPMLAHATTLPFLPTTAPVQHGGLRVRLFRTDKLA